MSYAATSPPRMPTLVLLAGISVLSLNMFLPSLANIAVDFEADYALVSLAIAGYLATTAVLQLIIGPTSDRYGRRPVLLCALFLFLVASAGCLLARDIEWFLLCRVFQGGVIAGWVLSMAAIRDSRPEREAASLIAYVSMAMAIAPMLGPMIGGFLDEWFGWRSNFVLYTVLGAVALVLVWWDFGETHKNPSGSFSDQFRSYPELLTSRRYWGYVVCGMFSVGCFYVFLTGVPLVSANVLHLSPGTLGFFMGTITAGFMAGSFVSGRIAKRYPPMHMILAGRLVTCAGLSVGLLMFLIVDARTLTLFLSTAFIGIGNGLSQPSNSAGAMSLRPHLAGSAAGLLGASSVGGGAILTSLTSLLLRDNATPERLLLCLLVCALLALTAALYVGHIDRLERTSLPNA